VRLRAAVRADVEPVAALERALFGIDAWSPAVVESELFGASRCAVVAEDRQGVVGYAITATAGDVVDLQRIAVHPDARRQGLARRMLEALLELAGGADRMLLEVSARNPAALAFYAAAGFVEIDRRRRYYRDGSDAVVLGLALAPACGGRRRA
jgi:[ribosomal protein S18]-alanine N-acetyltransferase